MGVPLEVSVLLRETRGRHEDGGRLVAKPNRDDVYGPRLVHRRKVCDQRHGQELADLLLGEPWGGHDCSATLTGAACHSPPSRAAAPAIPDRRWDRSAPGVAPPISESESRSCRDRAKAPRAMSRGPLHDVRARI